MEPIFAAFRYLADALSDAKRQPLAPWVIVPTLFNLLLFGALYWMAGSWISDYVATFTSDWQLEGLFSFLNAILGSVIWLIQLFIWVLLLALFASVFTIAVQLVAAPFMGLLAEKVDQQVCGTPLQEESMGQMVLRTFKRELIKTWDWLWRTALVGLLSLVLWFIVPPLASIVWFLWSGWLLGIQYVDYGADTRQVSFSTLRQQAKDHRLLVLTFGSLVLALTMIPLINLVIMPVAVIAGTRIWHKSLNTESLEENVPEAAATVQKA